MRPEPVQTPAGRMERAHSPGNQVRPGTEQPDSEYWVPWDSGIENSIGFISALTRDKEGNSHYTSKITFAWKPGPIKSGPTPVGSLRVSSDSIFSTINECRVTAFM